MSAEPEMRIGGQLVGTIKAVSVQFKMPRLAPAQFAKLRQLVQDADPCQHGFHCEHSRCGDHCCECGAPRRGFGR